MEELLAFSKPIQPVNKRIIQRKSVEKRKPIVYKKRDVNVQLVDHPKPSEYIAYLSSESYGNFYNKEDPTDDYFFKCLQSLKTQQLILIGDLDEVKYITPFTAQGFKFKPAKKVLYCFDKYGTPIDYTKCINKLCKIKLQVRPYDFVKDTRIAGLSIKVCSVILL